MRVQRMWLLLFGSTFTVVCALAGEFQQAPNPEKGLRGYHVYRIDGRWNADPLSRLTREPVVTTTFTDRQAGKSSRRYHIVAVDRLGQEGLPSAPVWHNREWQRFYVPFVDEWHQ